MEKIKDYLKKIYGLDALSCGCILLSVLINLVTSVLVLRGYAQAKMWNLAAYIPLVICFLRFFSTSRRKRSAENEWFISKVESLFAKKADNDYGQAYRLDRNRQIQREDRKHFRFFKCPACRQKIRVPRGKGRIEITCPRCGSKFIKKS